MGKYVLQTFETKTGILLNIFGERCIGEQPSSLKFNSVEDAKKHIIKTISPNTMCVVSNALGEVVYEHIYDVVYKVPKKWRYFWK